MQSDGYGSARLRTFEAALYKFAHYITLHYYFVVRAARIMNISVAEKFSVFCSDQ